MPDNKRRLAPSPIERFAREISEENEWALVLLAVGEVYHAYGATARLIAAEHRRYMHRQHRRDHVTVLSTDVEALRAALVEGGNTVVVATEEEVPDFFR